MQLEQQPRDRGLCLFKVDVNAAKSAAKEKKTLVVVLTATPQQNGRSEPNGQTLAFMTRCRLNGNSAKPEEAIADEMGPARAQSRDMYMLHAKEGNLLEEDTSPPTGGTSSPGAGTSLSG